MNVYAYQLDIVWEDKDANFKKVRDWTSRTKPQSGSLLVLPELFATGFSMGAQSLQEPEDGLTESFLKELARDTACYVMGGLVVTRSREKPTNDALLINPEGNRVGHYSKIQPFNMGKEGENYEAGNDIQCFELSGELRLCPFICYDLRFPELFRKAMMMENPPHIFVVIASWPNMRTHHWTKLLEARAIENLTYVAGVNRCGSDPYLEYDGASVVVDPHGDRLAEAGSEEIVISANLDINLVQDWRNTFPALEDSRPDWWAL